MAACLALVASGMIALSSCTSGQQAPTPPKSSATSATSVPPEPASSSDTASPGPAVGAPTLSAQIRLLTEVFATPLPADPAKAAIVESFRESQILWDESTEHLVIAPTATDYITGQALANLRASVSQSAKDFVALAGTDRLFNTSVTQVTADSAILTSCDDGRKTNIEDLATGQKIPNNPSPPLVFFVTWHMVPLAGHWAIASVNLVTPPDPRARACLSPRGRDLGHFLLGQIRIYRASIHSKSAYVHRVHGEVRAVRAAVHLAVAVGGGCGDAEWREVNDRVI